MLYQMMHCVHCNAPGIRAAAKRWSGRDLPATCTLCGKLSHVIASTGSGIPVATLLVVLGFAVAGALWGALCGLPVAVAYNVWAWRRAEMFPIAPETAANARRASWLVTLLSALGIFGS
jgi:hypothetical protein